MPTTVTLVRSSTLSDVAEYAYAATAPTDARLVFLAGSCPLEPDGSTAAVGDDAGQAPKAVENMTIALGDAFQRRVPLADLSDRRCPSLRTGRARRAPGAVPGGQRGP